MASNTISHIVVPVHTCNCACASIQDGTTALHLAAQEDHTDIVDVLLKGGADCNVQDKVIPFITII